MEDVRKEPKTDFLRPGPHVGAIDRPGTTRTACLSTGRGMITSRRKERPDKKKDKDKDKDDKEKEAAEALSSDVRDVLTKKPLSRLKWLQNALIHAGKKNFQASVLYDICCHPKFVAGCGEATGMLMRDLLLANLHLFKKDQQKALEKNWSDMRKLTSGAGDAGFEDDRPPRRRETSRRGGSQSDYSDDSAGDERRARDDRGAANRRDDRRGDRRGQRSRPQRRGGRRDFEDEEEAYDEVDDGLDPRSKTAGVDDRNGLNGEAGEERYCSDGSRDEDSRRPRGSRGVPRGSRHGQSRRKQRRDDQEDCSGDGRFDEPRRRSRSRGRDRQKRRSRPSPSYEPDRLRDRLSDGAGSEDGQPQERQSGRDRGGRKQSRPSPSYERPRGDAETRKEAEHKDAVDDEPSLAPARGRTQAELSPARGRAKEEPRRGKARGSPSYDD